MPRNALLGFFIAKEGEKVASALQQVAAFNQPMSHLRKCGVEEAVFDFVAQHARNGLDRYFPSAFAMAVRTNSRSATSPPSSLHSGIRHEGIRILYSQRSVELG
jgi:hypothetical protein